MKKCAIYSRVSTLKDEQKNSLKNQKQYFTQYIQSKNDLELYNIYTDSLTGTKANRPGFVNMLQDGGLKLSEDNKHFILTDKEPKYNTILCKSVSRFARNILAIEIIRLLRGKNINIIFLEENIDTGSKESDFYLSLMGAFSENYSRDLSSKVTFGHMLGAQNNVIMANSRLYGYKYNHGDNSLSIIDNEAQVVKLIYELYIKGYGFRKIANYLADNKIYTRAGKVFCKTTLNRILKNEKYAGLNCRGKYHRENILVDGRGGLRMNPRENWIIQENNRIPPIIDLDTFEKAQELLQNRKTNNHGLYKSKSPWCGKIICGKCGKTYNSNTDGSRKFYNCKTKKQRGVKVCNNKNISQSKLDSIFTNTWLIDTLSSVKLMRITYIHRAIDKLKASIDKDNTKQLKKLEAQRSTLNIKLDKLVDLYLDDAIDKSIYDTKKNALERQIKALNTKIDTLNKPIAEINAQISEKEELIKSINNMYVKKAYTQEEINSYINHIVIKDNEITIYLNIGDSILEIPTKQYF